MVHGLLTASLATKTGGQLGFIARRMDWEFLRPARACDTIEAKVTVRGLAEAKSGVKVEFDLAIENQHGESVLRGDNTGLIRR